MNAKFGAIEIKMIREDPRTAAALAKELGCSNLTVYRIRRGSTYKEEIIVA